MRRQRVPSMRLCSFFRVSTQDPDGLSLQALQHVVHGGVPPQRGVFCKPLPGRTVRPRPSVRRTRQGAPEDVLGLFTFVRGLSQRASASHQQGWTVPPQGEAVLDELAQSHYMQLCFGRNFLRHAALLAPSS